MRRAGARIISTVVLAAVTVTGCGRNAAPRSADAAPIKAQPNLILVLADDLGWNELSGSGNTFNRTPNLDRLAAEGVRFTRAYAAAPVCSPTRASLYTGQYPARVGITDFLRPDDSKYLHPRHHTLAEALQEGGYATALVGKWHLMGDYRSRRGDPRLHGFDEVILSETRYIGPGDYVHPYEFAPGVAAEAEGEFLIDRLNDEAVRFVRRNAERPFFLVLSHYAVHTVLHGRPDRVDRFAARPAAGGGRWAPRNNPHLAAQLEAIDEGVGQIRAELEAHGIADRTLIVFTSDNGADPRVTSTAPLRGGKSTLYEGGLRVPLLVGWPGRVAEGISAVPTSTVDLYPTLLAAAGIDAPADQPLDGISLLPLLEDGVTPERETLFWHYPLAYEHRLGGRSAGAVRSGRHKLIDFYDNGEVELYDLQLDPREARNLAGERPELAAELAQRLRAWRERVGAKTVAPAR